MKTTGLAIPNSDHGLTLLEMLLVLIIVGAIALAALPGISTDNDRELDQAAREVAGALRFARGEAMRTGKIHGLKLDVPGMRLRAYRLDQDISPPLPVYDVADPMSLRPYELDLKFGGGPVGFASHTFKYSGLSSAVSAVEFAGLDGLPHINYAGSRYLLQQAEIMLQRNGQNRTVSLLPVTARVTVR